VQVIISVGAQSEQEIEQPLHPFAVKANPLLHKVQAPTELHVKQFLGQNWHVELIVLKYWPAKHYIQLVGEF